MDKNYLKPVLVLFFLLEAGSASAGNLCNSNCLLSITFPSSGAIEAVEPLTITFGDGGLVDTSGSVTAYLAGETLVLNAGESLAFEAGGSFDIGAGGNMAYTNLGIVTDGAVLLSAVGGEERVQISAGASLVFSGGGSVELNSSIVGEGSLEIGQGSTLYVGGPGAFAGCEINSTSGAILTAQPGNPITIDTDSNCNDVYTSVANSSLSGSGSIQVIDPLTNILLGELTLIENSVAGGGTLILNGTDEGSGQDGAGQDSGANDDGEDPNATALGLYLALLLCLLRACRCLRRAA